MASKAAFERLKRKGYPVDECPYNSFDMLESGNDIAALSEILGSFRDARGAPAVMTANMIVGNPDFAEIRAADLEGFFVKPFWETLSDYGHAAAVSAYKEAFRAGILMPQLHGREHTAWWRWLETLRLGAPSFRDAFDEGMYAVHPGGMTSGRRDHLDALGYAPAEAGFSHLEAALEQAETTVDHVVANRLVIENGAVTGDVDGSVLDGQKDGPLGELAVADGVDLEQTIAVGNGATDLSMLRAAGTAVGFNPEPVVEQYCDVAVTSVRKLHLYFEQHGIIDTGER